MSTRVFLVDDHECVTDSVKRRLERSGSSVVGVFKNLDNVAEEFRKEKPDLLIVDVRICDADHGVDFCEQLIKSHPDARTIILSQFDQSHLVEKAYRVGVLAYVLKNESMNQLIAAVDHASKGEVYFSVLSSKILAKRHVSNDPVLSLSEKEKKVLSYLANGLTQEEISELLKISVKMVSNYSKGIKEKLGTDRVAELTKIAIRHGLASV